MSPFITFRDTDKSGALQYYILQRDFPHYIGRISERPEVSLIEPTMVPNYKLFIIFGGVLQGNFLPAHSGIEDELKGVFQKMADFYYRRILEDPKRYKKWAMVG